jgi:Ca2+-binding RTX toxin-like protein
MHAQEGNDVLKGLGGSDYLWGARGADRIFGASGSDMLSGGRGNDRLYGDEGRDFLFGDTGKDILSGGSGRDTFFVNGGDRIRDYQTGETVVIDEPSGSSLRYRSGILYCEGEAIVTLTGSPTLRLSDVTFDY